MAAIIGAQPVTKASRVEKEFTLLAGNTTITTPYTPGLVELFAGGFKIPQSEYTALNGSTIILNTAVASDTIINVVSWSSFVPANTLAKTGDTMLGDLTVPSLNSGQLAGFRNRIVNGDMLIWQRGTSVSTSGYTVDQWRQTSANTVTQSTDVPQGFSRSAKITSNATTLDFRQLIGHYGQFYTGQILTLSFWAKTSVASQTLKLFVASEDSFNSATNRVVEVNNVTIATTTTGWNKYTYTFTVKGINTTNILMHLALYIPNYTGDLYITGVQLEEGLVATPFEKLHPATILEMCQKFYFLHDYSTGGSLRWTNYSTGSNDVHLNYFLPTTMRVPPTCYALVDVNDGGEQGVSGYPGITRNTVWIIVSALGAGSFVDLHYLSASAEL